MGHNETTRRIWGRPFAKGHIPHNKRKTGNEILDDSRDKNDNRRGNVASLKDKATQAKKTPKKKEDKPMAGQLELFREENEIKKKSPAVEKPEEDSNQLTEVETIDFISGKNKITLRLSKKQTRLYRMQIFLNDKMELRPATYNGSSVAYNFWTLLKEIIQGNENKS